MSVYDDFRALAADLFAEFEAPTATIERTTAAPRSNADRAAGIAAKTTSTSTVQAVMGKRHVTASDGTTYVESTAVLSGPAQEGDRLIINGATYTITSVDEINPDGTTPMVWKVVLK